LGAGIEAFNEAAAPADVKPAKKRKARVHDGR
jgi:hypothetical protein